MTNLNDKLDEMVYKRKAEEATEINNCGVLSQLRYLEIPKILEYEVLKMKDPYYCSRCNAIFSRESGSEINKEFTSRFSPGDTFSDVECGACGAVLIPLEAALK